MQSRCSSSSLALVAAAAVAATLSVAHAAPAGAGEELAPVRPGIYAPVTLSADLKGLTEKERTMVSLLIDAAKIMTTCSGSRLTPATARRCSQD